MHTYNMYKIDTYVYLDIQITTSVFNDYWLSIAIKLDYF